MASASRLDVQSRQLGGDAPPGLAVLALHQVAGELAALAAVGRVDPDADRLAVFAGFDRQVGAGLFQGGGPHPEREVLEGCDAVAGQGAGQEQQHVVVAVPAVRSVGDLPGPDGTAHAELPFRVAPSAAGVLAEAEAPSGALLVGENRKRLPGEVAHSERHHHQAALLAFPELADLVELVLADATDGGGAARANVHRSAGDNPGEPRAPVPEHRNDAARQYSEATVLESVQAGDGPQRVAQLEARVPGGGVGVRRHRRPGVRAAVPRGSFSRFRSGVVGGHVKIQAADLHVRSSRGRPRPPSLYGWGGFGLDGRGGACGPRDFALGALLARLRAVHTRPFAGRVGDGGPAVAAGSGGALSGVYSRRGRNVVWCGRLGVPYAGQSVESLSSCGSV